MSTSSLQSTLPSRPVSLLTGDTMPEEQMGPLTRTDFVLYAGAGGDFNPIHHDETLARSLGLPSVFGMGMLHAGKLGTCLARWVGPLNIRAYSVRFTGQVWPGDSLAFSGSVDAVEERDGERLAQISLQVARQTGEVALTAKATAVTGAGT